MTMLNGTIKPCKNAMESMANIKRAIQAKGTATALAEVMGVRKQTVSSWASKGLPPLEFAMRLDVGTEGKIKAEEVCRPEDAHIVSALRKFDRTASRRRPDYGKRSKRGPI